MILRRLPWQRVCVELSVVLVAGALLATLPDYLSARNDRASRNESTIQAGQPFHLAKYGLEGRYMLLVWSPNCRYSLQSVRFFSELLRTAAPRIRAFVVTTTEKEAEEAAVTFHTSRAKVLVMDPKALGVSGTPSIIMVGDRKILALWEGKQSERFQETLLSHIEGKDYFIVSILGQQRAVRADEFAAFLKSRVLLNVGDRANYRSYHSPGAINIPSDELLVRARAELHPQDHILLDCGNTTIGTCSAANTQLAQAGRPDVEYLDIGAVGSSCKITRFPVESRGF